MTKRLLNSVKNDRARARWIERLAKSNLSNMGKVQDRIDDQEDAWQKGESAGNDIITGDRDAPTRLFRPRMGGGGTFIERDGSEQKAADDAQESRIAGLLASTTNSGTGATGDGGDEPLEGAAALREEGRRKLREAGLGGIADFAAGTEGAQAGMDWLLEETDAAETPANLGQGLINVLSTGMYAGARAAEGIGAAIDAGNKRGDDAGPFSGLQTLGESAVNAVGGAARGVAEGFGARFDGERPRTWGQNAEALGSKEALQGALGEDAGNVAQGALGTALDIGLDPTTYLTLGLSGVGEGAVEGAKLAAAAGKTQVGKAARGTVGAVKGGFKGAAKQRAKLVDARNDATLARELRKASRRGVDIAGAPAPVEQLALTAGRGAPEASAMPEQEAQRLFVGGEQGVFEPQNLDLRSDQLALPAKASDYRTKAPSVEAVQAGARLAEPTIRATDQLAPSLRGTVGAPKLDLEKLLTAGSRPVATKTPFLSTEASAHMTAIVSGARNAAKVSGGSPERAIRGAMGQLESNPSIAPRLDAVVDDAGTTLRELAEAAMRGNKAATNALAKVWRREIDETAQVVQTPALRQAIDEAAPGLREGLGVEKSKLHRMVSRLNATADPTKQQAILNRALGKSYQRGYADFREALAGVARGELDPSQMSEMIAALGIKTRASSPAGLRDVLNTKGVAAYEEALAKIPTPEQVRAEFNITDEVEAQMAAVDPDAVLADVSAASDDLLVAVEAEDIAALEIPLTDINVPKPKPAVTPQRTPSEFTGHDFDASGPGRNQKPNPVGRAAYAGVRALGRLLKESAEGGKRGNTLASYTDNDVTKAVHKAVFEQLKMSYLKKGGAERAERVLPRWLEAMNVVDTWARSHGMFPHMTTGENGSKPFYVSPAQVFELLDERIIGAAMFAPLKNRKSADSEALIGYVNGMTLYPNHIMSGLKVALAGGTPDEVAAMIVQRAVGASKGMQRGTDSYVKAFAETKRGQEAVQRLAEELTDPDVLESVRMIDARVRPVAEAINQRYIDGIVARAGERLIATIKDGGDRGTLMKVIDEVGQWAEDSARPALLESDRISATVQERLNSAIVKGILGEDGFLTAQHDWAFTNALETASPAKLAEEQAASLARERARLSGVRPATRGAADDLKPVQERGAVAVAAKPFVDDALEHATAEVEEALGARYADLPEELHIEADARIAHSLGEAVGRATSGKFGQADLWGTRVAAEEGTYAQAARYRENMSKWIDTVAARLTAERGTKVKPQEALDFINGPIFRALAATDPENWGNTGKIYGELITGRTLPRIGDAMSSQPAFNALSDFEANIAIELMKFVDHVFNPNATGMLGRSGLSAADLVDASKWHLRGAMEAYRLDPGEALTAQAQKWRAWSEAESPLDLIERTHRAIQSAMVPQQLGHQLAPLFGHTALRPGVPTKQLYAEGWRRINTGEATGVGRFADPDAYFPPYVLEQIRHLDAYLGASRGFNPDSKVGRFVVKPYDAATHLLKSMNTIWRPGHHVTNVLGEFGMLVMAGVNPLQVRRSIKTIQAGGGALDADMSVLDDLVRTARGKEIPDPKFAKDTVGIVLRDGRGGHRIEEVPLRTIWEWAVNSGVALTHTASRDLMDDLSTGVARTVWNSNPVAKTDEALGRFSAVRDNMTRVAHFIDGLEKGTYANLEQAKAAAITKVHDYHPTVRTLSRWEQKYARRIVFFYTWVRQAIERVLKTAMDQPGFVTMPFKAQYELAEANGLEPESVGGPTTTDPRIPSWTRNSLLGPTMSAEGEEGLPDQLWQASLSSPQIDTLQTLFGLFTAKPGTGNPVDDAVNNAVLPAYQTGIDMLNPVLGTIPEALTQSKMLGGAGKGFTELAAESAGLPTAIARSVPAGSSEQGESVYSTLFPDSSGASGLTDTEFAALTDEEQQAQRDAAAGEMQRYLVNLLTGTKWSNPTNEKSSKRAKDELREEMKRKLAEQGITDPDTVTAVRDWVWDERMARRN